MSAKLLDAVTATGAGGSIVLNRNPASHSVQLTMGGTLVATAVTVVLEGSLDNVTWFAIDTHAMSAGEITAEGALYAVNNITIKYVRANLTVLTGGTAPTVTALYLWSEIS